MFAAHFTLQRVTQNQMEIFRTPADVIWVPKSDEYKAEVVEDTNVRKLKGSSRLRFDHYSQ
jgi:hypothetical protein